MNAERQAHSGSLRCLPPLAQANLPVCPSEPGPCLIFPLAGLTTPVFSFFFFFLFNHCRINRQDLSEAPAAFTQFYDFVAAAWPSLTAVITFPTDRSPFFQLCLIIFILEM